jgi:hypothetical protein
MANRRTTTEDSEVSALKLLENARLAAASRWRAPHPCLPQAGLTGVPHWSRIVLQRVKVLRRVEMRMMDASV